MSSLIYIAILVIFFLWMRSSTKKNQAREKNLQDSLRPGMYIMLKDGLYGTIVDVEPETVIVNFSVDGSDEGCMSVMKTGVSTIVEQSDALFIPGNPETDSAQEEQSELSGTDEETADDEVKEEISGEEETE